MAQLYIRLHILLIEQVKGGIFMAERKMPELLTPEVVKAVAENAGAIKTAISSGEEKAVMGCNQNTQCCCPKLVKFKFVLCNVWIDVKNAVCPDNTPL